MENVRNFFFNKKTLLYSSVTAQIITFIILFVQATISAQYRLAYGDAAFALFRLCADKTFFCPHNRYIAVFSEYLPLLGIYLQLSFKHIAILYSNNLVFTSFILWGIYLLLTKKWEHGWIFISSQIIGLFEGYNHFVLEQVGYIFVCFFILLLDYVLSEKNKQNYLLAITTFAICLSAPTMHMNSLVVLCVGYTYLFFVHHKAYKFLIIHTILVLISIILFRKYISSFNVYEVSKLSAIQENLKNIYHLDQSGYSQYFKVNYTPNEYLRNFYILIVILCLYYRKWMILLMIIAFYFICFYFNCLLFNNWETSGYMEYYGEFIFISILIGLYFALKNHSKNWVVLLFYIYIFHFSLENIYAHQKRYRDREIYIHQLCQNLRKNNKSKAYIFKKDIDYQKLFLDWALPYESMNSSLYRDEKLVSLYAIEDSTQMKNLSDEEIVSNVSIDKTSNFKTNYYGSIKNEPYAIYKP